MLDAVCVLNAGGSVDFLDETKTVEEAFQDEAAPPPPPEIRPDTPWYAKLLGRTSSAKIAHLGNTEGEFYYCEQRKRWVLEGDDEEQPGTPGRSVSEDDVVLAIQAATLRRSLSTSENLGSLAQRTQDDLRRTLPNHFSAPARAATRRRSLPQKPTRC